MWFDVIHDLVFRLVPPGYIEVTPLQIVVVLLLAGWGVFEWKQWKKYR